MIQTNIEKLILSLENTQEEVYIGMVEYKDLEKEYVYEDTSLRPFLIKDKYEYSQEKELRLIYHPTSKRSLLKDIKFFLKRGLIYNKKKINKLIFEYNYGENFKKGKNIAIDLTILIDKVYLSPKSDDDLYSKYLSLLLKNNLNKKILKSKISANV